MKMDTTNPARICALARCLTADSTGILQTRFVHPASRIFYTPDSRRGERGKTAREPGSVDWFIARHPESQAMVQYPEHRPGGIP